MRRTRRRWRRGALPCASGALCPATREALSLRQTILSVTAWREGRRGVHLKLRCCQLGHIESSKTVPALKW